MDFASFTPEYLARGQRRKWEVPPGGIGAWVAEMDFGIPPAVAAALHRLTEEGSFGYPTTTVKQELRAATASWFADRYGWQVPERDIFVVSDVIGALLLSLRHLLPQGTPVVVPTPAYMPFLTVTGAFGYPAHFVPGVTDDGVYRLDLDAISDQLAAGARLIVLTNPHNPVGRVYTREELLALSEVVESHGALVFADEIHAPLVLDERLRHVPYASVSDAAAAHAITSTAASKGWNIAGLKCSQLVISSRELLAPLKSPINEYYGGSASTPGYVASTVAYRDSREWIDDVVAYLRNNSLLLADLVAENLPGAHYTVPEGTYLAWLDMRELGLESPGDFFQKNAGVRCNDGATCGAPGYLRFNIAMAEATMHEALTRMGAALRTR